MDSTTINALPYPELSDAPDIPTHIEGLAQALDTRVIPKFASAAARDAAITSPTSGQHCFQTDDQKFYCYNGGYSAWLPYNQSVIKTKPGTETLGNSTTLQDDNHLIDFPLKSATSYLLRGVIMVTSPAAADFKVALSFTVAPTEGTWCSKHDEVGTNVIYNSAAITSSFSPATQGSPSVQFLTIEGYFISNVTPATMKFQWAKNTADAGTTTVFGGSWLEIMEG